MTREPQVFFPPFRLDLHQGRIWREEEEVFLRPKSAAVLCYLAQRHGQFVSKPDLLAAVWSDTCVGDGALKVCIRELRKMLGDEVRAPRFIESVHRRGYRFIGEVVSSPLSSPAARSQFLDPAFVGRETELAYLHSLLDNAWNGERQIVFVTGEAGIGKTTLVETFLKGLRHWERGPDSPSPQLDSQSQFPNPGCWVAWGQCIDQYGTGEAYLPMLEALGRLCRHPNGTDCVKVLTQYAPTWLLQLPALLTEQESRALQRRVSRFSPNRMLREMAEALEVLTEAMPLVLVLEDLHWSDTATMQLLTYLARRPEPARLLVIGTYRTGEPQTREPSIAPLVRELRLHRRCQELSLPLLSEAAVEQYLTARYNTDQKTLGDAHQWAAEIVRRTEGNPLFLVNVVDNLLSQSLAHENGSQTHAPQLRTPETLRHLIEHKIESLSHQEQTVLAAASVVGGTFAAAAIAAALEEDVTTVEEHCTRLASHEQFVQVDEATRWPDQTISASYRFRHALYQEVLYTQIPAGTRAQWHQSIGSRLEVAYGEQARDIATELAVHFGQGGNIPRATHYRQEAAQTALRRFAYREAVEHLTVATTLVRSVPSDRDRLELVLCLSLAEPLVALYGEAAAHVEQTYAQAWELCQRVTDRTLQFHTLQGLGITRLVRGDIEHAHAVAHQAMRLAQREQSKELELAAHHLLGMTCFYQGDVLEARAHIDQALIYNSQLPHPELRYTRVIGLSHTANVLWVTGYPDQALQRSDEAVTLARTLQHPHTLAFALCYAALLAMACGQIETMQTYTEEAIAVTQRYELSLWHAVATVAKGWVQTELEKGEVGLRLLHEGLAAYRATGAAMALPNLLAMVVSAALKAGRYEDASMALNEALDRVHHSKEKIFAAWLYQLKGELTLQQCHPAPNSQSLTPALQIEAEACFRKAISIARKQQAKSLELRAVISLARFHQQHVVGQGPKSKKPRAKTTKQESHTAQHDSSEKHAEARRMLSDAYNSFTEGFTTKDMQEAKALLDERYGAC